MSTNCIACIKNKRTSILDCLCNECREKDREALKINSQTLRGQMNELTEKHYEEGDCCDVEDCPGFMGYESVVGCSCHINPPCSQCVENPLVCLHCGWTPGEPTTYGYERGQK